MCINLVIIHTQYVYFISFVITAEDMESYWWWSSIRRRARKVKAFDHLRPTTIYVNAAERKQRNAKGTLRKVQSDHGLEIAVVHTSYTFPFMYFFRPNIPFSICYLVFYLFNLLEAFKHGILQDSDFVSVSKIYSYLFLLFCSLFLWCYDECKAA